MSSYHYGDKVTQIGDQNIGMIKNQMPVDPQAALREMVRAVELMRGQVTESDRLVIDESMETIGSGNNSTEGAFRQALSNIAGVAAVVGQVGVPVIEAIRAVITALGV